MSAIHTQQEDEVNLLVDKASHHSSPLFSQIEGKVRHTKRQANFAAGVDRRRSPSPYQHRKSYVRAPVSGLHTQARAWSVIDTSPSARWGTEEGRAGNGQASGKPQSSLSMYWKRQRRKPKGRNTQKLPFVLPGHLQNCYLLAKYHTSEKSHTPRI